MLKSAIKNEITKLEAQAKQLVANANANAGALQAFRHVLELLNVPIEGDKEAEDDSNPADSTL